MKTRKNRLIVLSLALMLALSIGLFSSASAAGSLQASEIDGILNTATDKAQNQSPFTHAVNEVRDSVVGVNNYQTVTQNYGNYNFPFRFEDGSRPSRQRIYTGSGVVISPWGHILTNFHVVDGADRLTVTYGSKEAEATVVASDEGQDIAVLLVSGIDLQPVTLADSDQVQVGEWAIVIGNPLGQEFERTVTVGVISAYDREVSSQVRDRYGRSGAVTKAMIQVDAAINNGNSGGGLFNVQGQLMGVPSLKYDNAGMGGIFGGGQASIDNIGMALPINAAKPLIREALEKYDGTAVTPAAVVDHDAEAAAASDPNKPRMGVTVTTLNPQASMMLQGKLPNGAYIMEIEAGSPADKAGLKPGDIIVEANGTVVDSSTSLVSTLSTLKAGDEVAIKYFRAENLHGIVTEQQDPATLGEGAYADVQVKLEVLNKTL